MRTRIWHKCPTFPYKKRTDLVSKGTSLSPTNVEFRNAGRFPSWKRKKSTSLGQKRTRGPPKEHHNLAQTSLISLWKMERHLCSLGVEVYWENREAGMIFDGFYTKCSVSEWWGWVSSPQRRELPTRTALSILLIWKRLWKSNLVAFSRWNVALNVDPPQLDQRLEWWNVLGKWFVLFVVKRILWNQRLKTFLCFFSALLVLLILCSSGMEGGENGGRIRSWEQL